MSLQSRWLEPASIPLLRSGDPWFWLRGMSLRPRGEGSRRRRRTLSRLCSQPHRRGSFAEPMGRDCRDSANSRHYPFFWHGVSGECVSISICAPICHLGIDWFLVCKSQARNWNFISTLSLYYAAHVLKNCILKSIASIGSEFLWIRSSPFGIELLIATQG